MSELAPSWDELSDEVKWKLYAEESTMEQLFLNRQTLNGEGLPSVHYQLTIVEPSPDWRADNFHYVWAGSHEEIETHIKENVLETESDVMRVQVVRAEESLSEDTASPFTILDSAIVTEPADALNALEEVTV